MPYHLKPSPRMSNWLSCFFLRVRVRGPFLTAKAKGFFKGKWTACRVGVEGKRGPDEMVVVEEMVSLAWKVGQDEMEIREMV